MCHLNVNDMSHMVTWFSCLHSTDRLAQVWKKSANLCILVLYLFSIKKGLSLINLHVTNSCDYSAIKPHFGCSNVYFSDFVPFDLSAAFHSQH